MNPLKLEPSSASAPIGPPPPRGRLLSAEQVAMELLHGSVGPAWVRRHVPHGVRLGHSTVRWFEADVVWWIEARRRA
jgi:hypothetical protein